MEWEGFEDAAFEAEDREEADTFRKLTRFPDSKKGMSTHRQLHCETSAIAKTETKVTTPVIHKSVPLRPTNRPLPDDDKNRAKPTIGNQGQTSKENRRRTKGF